MGVLVFLKAKPRRDMTLSTGSGQLGPAISILNLGEISPRDGALVFRQP